MSNPDAPDVFVKPGFPVDETYESENIVCPCCGHEMSDSWEFNSGQAEWDDEIDCNECGTMLNVSKTISIRFTARAKVSA